MGHNSGNNFTIHRETIADECFLLIQSLGRLDTIVEDYYLVGGTALALQIGHRLSIDLDFFTLKEFNSLSLLNTVKTTQATVTNTRIGSGDLLLFANNVKVEFVYYAYPPQYPLREWEGIKLLDPRDIALFKLLALAGRHTRKDIVDLYFIDKLVMPLEQVFTALTQKYESGDINLFKQLELLFDDSALAQSEMPVMLMQCEFDQAYQHVKAKLSYAIKNYFNL